MVLTKAYVGEDQELGGYYNTWTSVLACSCVWLLLTLLYIINNTLANIYLSIIEWTYGAAHLVAMVGAFYYGGEKGAEEWFLIGIFELILVVLLLESARQYLCR